MAIVTLTVNPALDKSTSVNQLVHTQKMYSEAPLFSPGGGGINVSRVLKRLDIDSLAIMQASGPNGDHLKAMLKSEDIQMACFNTKSWTRENFAVNEKSTQLQYRFDMPGPEITVMELKTVSNMVQANVKAGDYLVLSGSLPPSVSPSFYRDICQWAKTTEVKVILDSKGEALKEALSVGVYLVKPNLGELAELHEKDWISNQEAIEFAKQMIDQKQAELVVVSLGDQGAFLLSKDGLEMMKSPEVKVKSAVGAGDSMVAGIVYALDHQMPLDSALRYGIACGTATVLSEGTNLCSVNDVNAIYKKLASAKL